MSATNRGAERHVNDFYNTPSYTLQSLLDVLDVQKAKSFLEPCRGGGVIYNAMPIQDRDYAEILEGKDYLKAEFNKKYDLVVTNPPYSLASEFLQKSLGESGSVWYLLRLNFLESKKRAEWWQNNLPTHLLVLSARPSFTGNGTDATAYAWFGWDKNGYCLLPAGVHVLPYNK
jgi:hypothetical protein